MAQSVPSDYPSSAPKFLTALAHSLVYVLVVGLVLHVVSWFRILNDLDLIVTALLIMCLPVAVWHHHTGGLCIRCMAELPAHAPVRAERMRWMLRFAHFACTVKGLVVMHVVCFTPLLIVIFFPSVFADGIRSFVWFRIPGDIWISTLIYSTWLHHQLRPWCPYCRRWDDGGEPEPSPDPTVSSTKTAH